MMEKRLVDGIGKITGEARLVLSHLKHHKDFGLYPQQKYGDLVKGVT